jgi:hypothetical protein
MKDLIILKKNIFYFIFDAAYFLFVAAYFIFDAAYFLFVAAYFIFDAAYFLFVII